MTLGAWPRPHNDEEMNLNFTKPVIAAVALAAALSLTACGSSSDGGTAQGTTTATTSAAATSTTPPVPTVEELNTRLQMALDPAVSDEEKASLVEGLEADPTLLQQLSEKVAQAEADGLVSNIQVVGPTTPISAERVSVPFTMDINGQPQTSAVDVVVVDGEWKLAKDSICNLSTLLEISSPACAA